MRLSFYRGQRMNDIEVIAIGAVIFWVYVAWWIVATDPLAPDWHQRLFAFVHGVVKFVGVTLLFLGISGWIQEATSKRKRP